MSQASLASRLLRRWHRRLGLLAAVFFAFLAITGLVLNHGDAIDVEHIQVDAPWLMSWYGLKPAVPDEGFIQDGLVFSWQGDIWVLDGRRIKAGHGEPVGAVRIDGQVWLATADEIYLYDPEGHLIDKIERDLLPALPIHRIGARRAQLVAHAGSAVYVSADGIAWEKLGNDAAVAWSRMGSLSPAQRQQIAPLFAPSLPLQRILVDLHSGRIFGTYGVLATDALAAILLILAGSGVWMYASSRSKKYPRPRQPAAAASDLGRRKG